MTNIADSTRNQIRTLWQFTSTNVGKVVEKVDADTAKKVARVAGPILAAMLVLYLIHKLLKKNDIDVYEIFATQASELIKKLKKQRLRFPFFQKAQPAPDAERGLPIVRQGQRNNDDVDLVGSGQMVIFQGENLFAKVEDNTLNIALVVDRLHLKIFAQFSKGPTNLFHLEQVFIQGPSQIDPSVLEALYQQIQLPNIQLAPLNGVQLYSNPNALALMPVPNAKTRELLSQSIRSTDLLPDFAKSALKLWKKESNDSLQRKLTQFTPFKPKSTRSEFDHKNAEILNQVLHFLFICYWPIHRELEPNGLIEMLQSSLQNQKLEPLDRIFQIIADRGSYSSNEEVRTAMHQALCDIYKSKEYQKELQFLQKTLHVYQHASLQQFAEQFPLVYFAQNMARAFYLEVDLNHFETHWVDQMIGNSKVDNPTNFATWVSVQRSRLDQSAKGWNAILGKGVTGFTDFVYVQDGKVRGSLPNWGFNAVHTNNLAQRLWVQKSQKSQICLGLPVPTRDSSAWLGAPNATVVEDFLLTLDQMALTGKTFMSFMHLKIADKASGEVRWNKGEENIRAKALFELAKSERYEGTYWYFSIPMDGYLFTNPEKIEDPTIQMNAKELLTSTNHYRLQSDTSPSLYQFWMHAITNNRHGWFILHDDVEKHYGARLREMYRLEDDQPVVPQICHQLFMEVHEFFFQDKTELTKDEWQVFQVLLGVRMIETFSQFADVFHNTCKDAIDRAAVFLLARRYIQLIREGRTQEADELKVVFIDYVKRAVAAKVQAPIPHRHHTAEATLKLLQQFGLQKEYQEFSQKRPETQYTMDRSSITKRLEKGKELDLMSSWIEPSDE